MNVATTETYYQTSASDIDKLYMIIPARYNQEILVHPNLDTILPSNNISDKTIETINRMFRNNETITIQKLKSGDIVITFKEEIMKYKKENDWIIEIFRTQTTHIYHKIIILTKELPNKDITKAHMDLERLFEDLKRKNISNITRIKLRYIQQDIIYRILIINCNNI